MDHDTMVKLIRLERKDPLEVAIQKWEDIVNGKGRDENDFNCALCYVYRDYDRWYREHECDNCPIFKVTKKPYCQGTPWKATYGKHDLKANKKELKFLKSLRVTNCGKSGEK